MPLLLLTLTACQPALLRPSQGHSIETTPDSAAIDTRITYRGTGFQAGSMLVLVVAMSDAQVPIAAPGTAQSALTSPVDGAIVTTVCKFP